MRGPGVHGSLPCGTPNFLFYLPPSPLPCPGHAPQRMALLSNPVSGEDTKIKEHVQKMEIFGQAFRDLIKINITSYRSRKLNAAHVEESI